MRLLHTLAKTHASFDDPNLVSQAGLVPVMALAQRAGLAGLAARHVRPGGECGVNAAVKVPCLVAGMAAGADSIDDMDLLRHGAMETVFGGIRAPSTLGSFLRAFTWGNVSQLGRAHREFLVNLARQAPLLPGAGTLAFIDVDSTQKRVFGYGKQGARFGHTKIQGKSLLVKGLNALAATISTPLSAPVIGAVRLRGGNAATGRGAASLVKEAIGTARACGCSGLIIARLDSGYYSAAVISAIRSAGTRFSVTVPMNSSIRAAIAAIPGHAWTPIRYPRAIWDDQLHCWVSDAEVAETGYTAFTSKKSQAVTARLIVRRVRDQNSKAAQGQDELFCIWRYHAVFTDSPVELSRPRASTATTRSWSRPSRTGTTGRLPTCHPAFSPRTPPGWSSPPWHRIWYARPGRWPAPLHARARAATIRRDLIAVAARTARHGRGTLTLHLPEYWHREQEWLNLWHSACGPPPITA
jgi:Transposase DDE domain group 1